MPLALELFGGFRLVDEERRTVRVPERRARGLIVYLALAERSVPRLALAELLCPEGDEQDQRSALRQAVYVARKATAQPDLFDSVDDQIGLNEALLVSDVRRFQTAIARGDPDSLREAIELYRGPLLAGERSPSTAFEDWAARCRSELLEQVMKALLVLAEQHEAAGEHDRALALARQAVTLDPLREDARRQVMRSLAALGQRAAALREYETGRQLLADELQVSPDDATEMLRKAISRDEGTLANRPGAPAMSNRSAVADGASPPDRADGGAPGPAYATIDARRVGAPRWSAAAIAAILALAAAGLAAWWYSPRPQPPAIASASPAGAAKTQAALPLPDKPSIAVLPFENLSGDAKQEYFADAITDNIITELSRFSGLFVIARNSVFTYKGKPVKVQQVAEDLGVQYVLEGSVQRSGDQMRVTADLIDAWTGRQVWGERYDRATSDIFAVQDEVTHDIVARLGGSRGEVAEAATKRAKRKGTINLSAYEIHLLAVEYKHRFTKENNAIAAQLFNKAIELDPYFARAYSGLAWTYYHEVWEGWSKSPKESLDRGFEAARTAIDLDASDAEPYWALADLHLLARQYEEALAKYEQALALNPNYADIIADWGWFMYLIGRPEEAIEPVRKALRLNPNTILVRMEFRCCTVLNTAVRRSNRDIEESKATDPDFSCT